MAEHTPGYIAALAAALHHANMNALHTAQHGPHQLGWPLTNHPHIRICEGHALRIGHHPTDLFALEVNAIITTVLADTQTAGQHTDAHITDVSHQHVHLITTSDGPAWTSCTPDTDGAIPITIGRYQPDNDQENRNGH